MGVVNLEHGLHEFLLVYVLVIVFIHNLKESFAQNPWKVHILKQSASLLLCSYLNEGDVINPLCFLVGSFRQVLVDVLEVGNEHVLDEVLILLDVVVLEEDLVADDGCLSGEVVTLGSHLEGFLLLRLCLRLHY